MGTFNPELTSRQPSLTPSRVSPASVSSQISYITASCVSPKATASLAKIAHSSHASQIAAATDNASSSLSIVASSRKSSEQVQLGERTKDRPELKRRGEERNLSCDMKTQS